MVTHHLALQLGPIVIRDEIIADVDKKIAFIGFDHFAIGCTKYCSSLGDLRPDFGLPNSHFLQQFPLGSCFKILPIFQSATGRCPKYLPCKWPCLMFKLEKQEMLFFIQNEQARRRALFHKASSNKHIVAVNRQLFTAPRPETPLSPFALLVHRAKGRDPRL